MGYPAMNREKGGTPGAIRTRDLLLRRQGVRPPTPVKVTRVQLAYNGRAFPRVPGARRANRISKLQTVKVRAGFDPLLQHQPPSPSMRSQ